MYLFEIYVCNIYLSHKFTFIGNEGQHLCILYSTLHCRTRYKYCPPNKKCSNIINKGTMFQNRSRGSTISIDVMTIYAANLFCYSNSYFLFFSFILYYPDLIANVLIKMVFEYENKACLLCLQIVNNNSYIDNST